MRRRGRRVIGMCCVALAVVAALSGCRKETVTARELKEKYAMELRRGGSWGMTVIKAESVDPKTFDLIDVRVEDGTRILHAKRAEILVMEHNGTVALRLHDVVGSDTERGTLISVAGLTTETFETKYRVIPD